MYIHWIKGARAQGTVAVSERWAKARPWAASRVLLQLGGIRKELAVRMDPELPSDRIGLPASLTEESALLGELPFEIKTVGRQLHLGPVLAFVPVVRQERLTEETLEKFKPYMRGYSRIQGLVYVAAADGFRFDTRTVTGFAYRPSDGAWVPGVFPFPGAVYRKTGFGSTMNDRLTDALGDKVFNTYFFNKLELWEALSPYPELRRYLPDTARLTGIEALDAMLERHGEAYLKQIDGHKAKGIVRASRSGEGHRFVYRLKGEVRTESPEESEAFLRELAGQREYIVQQAVHVRPYDERNFDFRVILQKDGTGEWTCPGIIGRFGKKGSIATNFLLDGFSATGLESLKLAFGLNDREAFLKEQEIIRASREAAAKLDEGMGHYGDLGVDVIVDGDGRVWILEINKLHDHKYPLYGLNDEMMYSRVVTNPLLYAKRLADF